MHAHEHHTMDNHSGLNAMAANATLHCLMGCAIGEVIGLILGAILGWGNGLTILVSIALAFMFGFSLSSLRHFQSFLRQIPCQSLLWR
jgi:hypothetical protein